MVIYVNKEKYLLTDVEVAQILGLSPQTLRKARTLKRGIPFIRFGNKTVRYDPKDVMNYIDKCRKYPADLRKEEEENETNPS